MPDHFFFLNAPRGLFLVVLALVFLFFPSVQAGLFCELKTDDSHACDGLGPKAGPEVVVYMARPVGNCSPEFTCEGVCAPVVSDFNLTPSLCLCRTEEVDRFELNPACCSVKDFDPCKCDVEVILPLACANGSFAPTCDPAEAETYCASASVRKPLKLDWSGVVPNRPGLVSNGSWGGLSKR